MADDVLRLKATIVDQASPALRAISQEFAKFTRGVTTAPARREVEGLRSQFTRLGYEIRSVAIPALSSLGLAGGGVALGIATFARAARGYTEGVQDMAIASRTLGLSVRDIRAFQSAAEGVRIAPEAAIQGLQTFKKNAEDFQLRIGSLRDELRNLGSGDVVEGIRRAKEPLDQLRIAFARMEELQARNPAIARRYAEAMFGSADMARMGWEEFRKAFEKVRDLTDDEKKNAEQLNKAFIEIGDTLSSLKQSAMSSIIPGLATTMQELQWITDKVDALLKLGDLGGKGDLMGKIVGKLRGANDPNYPGTAPGAGSAARAPFVDNTNKLKENNDVLEQFKKEIEGATDNLKKMNFIGGGLGGGGGLINASLSSFGPGNNRRGGGFGNSEFPNLGGEPGGMPGTAAGGSVPKAVAGQGSGLVPGGNANLEGLQGSEYLAKQRERLGAEMQQNPELKKRFAALVDLENPGAGTAVAESAMNRAAMTGRSLSSILSGGPNSFYGPARRGMVEPRMSRMSQKTLEARYAQIDSALAGSNMIKGHTDQGSAGDPNYIKGGTGVNINRERFNDWGGFKGVEYSRRWREEQQRQVAEGGTRDPFMSPRPPVAYLDSSRMDAQIGGGKMTAEGTVNLNVTAPSGTKVDSTSSGLFQQTKIQRVRQMEPTPLSGPDDGSNR